MERKPYYFTCGQSHRHVTDEGVIWDKDSVIQVTADSAFDARNYVLNRFGNKWAFQYYDLKGLGLQLYYKGIVLKIDC